ncbi:hypothetical protein ACQP2U_21910 [Nocardia sp. CA-084685]|uniref:hypothetical protein n=1 Tax=Nocardia sp. CA-084685 TaxID=3239970 RepID=UPI003D954B47
MKGGARIAIGVGIGYLLGRTRKMRFALALAGAAMSRRSAGVSGELLEQGTSLLKSSPELAQITDTVKGELLGAVRSAAVTAASNRIDALNARLQQRAVPDSQEVRGESQERDSDEDEDEDERPADESAEEEPVEDESAEEEPAEDESAEEEPAEEEAAEDDEDAADEYDEDDSDRTGDEEAEPTSAPPRARRTRTTMRRTGSRTSDRSTGSAERKTPSVRRRRTRVDTDEADEAPVRRTRR